MITENCKLKKLFCTKTLVILFVNFVIACLPSFAQLAGTYYISDTSLYNSPKQAVESLTSQGMSAPVIFRILPGTYEGRFEIGAISGNSNTNTIRFESYNGDSTSVILTDSATVAGDNYVVRINSTANHITFNQLTIFPRGAVYARGIYIDQWVQSVTFKRCVFKGTYDAGNNSNKALIKSGDACNADSIFIEKCLFRDASMGIHLQGASDAIMGIRITGNSFKNIGYQGVFLYHAGYPEVTNNEISSHAVGIYISCQFSAHISGNKIFAGNTGINFTSNIFVETALIANNFLYTGNDADFGIYIAGNNPVNVLNNTIWMNENYWGNYGIYLYSGIYQNNVNIINNIIAHKYNGWPLYIDNLLAVDTVDYNCYYTPGNYIVQLSGNYINNLDNWCSLSGKDEHSIHAFPLFASDSDLHVLNDWPDGKGIPLASVTTDIDGEARDPLHPDIGADEFTPLSYLLPKYSGDYTIGPGAGDFSTLSEAIDSFKYKGISGNVTLKFLEGTHDVNTVIPSIPGSGSSAVITLTKQEGAGDAILTHPVQGDQDNYLIQFNGADFITISGLNFRSVSDPVRGRIFNFLGGSENIKITGNHFTSTYLPGSGGSIQLYANGNFFSDLEISDNLFDSCTSVIYFQSSWTSQAYCRDVRISNNVIQNVSGDGITLYRHSCSVIMDNHINTDNNGLELLTIGDSIQVTDNYIYNKIYRGIYLSVSEGTGGLIANNFITSGSDSYDAAGIMLSSCSQIEVLHNSINILTSHPSSGQALYVNNAQNLTILNNILKNDGSGYSFYCIGATFESLEYNDLLTNGTNLAYQNNTNYSDLPALQSGTGLHQNSLSVDPVYKSNIDLHLEANEVVGKGTPIARISKDIDGDLRNPFSPDIGADERISYVNQPPFVSKPIPDLICQEDIDTTLIADLDTVFIDPEGEVLALDAYTDNPLIHIFINGSLLKFKPQKNFSGTDEIIVTAEDPTGGMARDTFIITITNVNDPPLAQDDGASVRTNTARDIEVLVNDVDPDGDKLVISALYQGSHGTAAINPGDTTIHFIPETDFSGRDTLRYVITDNNGGYDTAYVHLIISASALFDEIVVNFDSVAFGNAIWGDIDNDKDYDIIVCGEKANSQKVTSVYRNNHGNFVKDPVELKGIRTNNDQSMAFGNLNTDTIPELIIMGVDQSGNPSIVIYSAGITGLREVEYGLKPPGLSEGSVDWGDYDQDGDMDLLLCGRESLFVTRTTLYRNEYAYTDLELKIEFTPVVEFEAVQEGIARFIDPDSDGDLDVIVIGKNESGELIRNIYINNNGIYSLYQFSGQYNGSIDIADWDADGYPDILTTGDASDAGFVPKTSLLRYTGGAFEEVNTGIENVFLSSADWGDYDNDGDFDLIICGKNESLTNITKLYRNDNGIFTEVEAGFPGIAEGTVCWGDYDQDGDLDVLLSGYRSDPPYRFTAIYKNNLETPNNPPSPPANLTTEKQDSKIIISWDPGTDTESAAELLSYNVRINRTRFSWEPNMTGTLSHADGILRFPETGNARQNNFIVMDGLQAGAVYTISVQTIDPGYAGSAFNKFTVTTDGDILMEQDLAFQEDATISCDWGDYDNDGDLDLAVLGLYYSHHRNRIYVNEGGIDPSRYITLNDSIDNFILWIDYDNDNDLDLFTAVRYKIFHFQNLLYENQDGAFIRTDHKLGIFEHSAFDWADYDNDGDIDLVVTGTDTLDQVKLVLFRNENGSFNEIVTGLQGITNGDIKWIDIENDGDYDLVLSGTDPAKEGEPMGYYISKIYINTRTGFVEIPGNIPGLNNARLESGDYDNDGDMDLIISGRAGKSPNLTYNCSVYKNENNLFINAQVDIEGMINQNCRWTDINNDGLLDIVTAGSTLLPGSLEWIGNKVIIYLNEGETFVRQVDIDASYWPGFTAGDFSNDSKTDLFIYGQTTGYSASLLYLGVTQAYNTPPSTPVNIQHQQMPDGVQISWSKGLDQQTYRDGLSYNLRVGTTPGGTDVLSPMALENGYRTVVSTGNMEQNTSWKLKNLTPDMEYFYSVQAIDHSYAGSAFTEDKSFVTPPEYVVGIEGKVIRPDTALQAGDCIVELYRGGQHGSFSLNDYISAGDSGYFYFPQVNTGTYLIKAVMVNSLPGIVNTWHLDASLWEDADPVIILNVMGDTVLTADILLPQFTPIQQGSGSISGTVFYSPAKKTASSRGNPGIYKTSDNSEASDPFVRAGIVLFKDGSTDPSLTESTDENGFYEFTGLPNGNYKIHVDIPGISLVNYHQVSITDLNQMFSQMDYVVDTVSGSIYNDIPELNGLASFVDIYPNPFSDKLNIDYTLDEEEYISISVFNMMGKKIESIVSEKQSAGMHRIEFQVQTAGIFIIEARFGDKVYRHKVVKQ